MDLDEKEVKIFLFAMGDYSRFSILAALAKKSMCVNEIAKETKIEQSNVSHHLACLANCGFVNVSRDGKKRVYSINKEVKPIIDGMLRHISTYKKNILACNIANKRYVSKLV